MTTIAYVKKFYHIVFSAVKYNKTIISKTAMKKNFLDVFEFDIISLS